MREKNDFLHTIAKRKVYVYNGIVHSEDPKKQMSKSEKRKLLNSSSGDGGGGGIARVEFASLPHLPSCPAIC
jgi:hypothetical protein